MSAKEPLVSLTLPSEVQQLLSSLQQKTGLSPATLVHAALQTLTSTVDLFQPLPELTSLELVEAATRLMRDEDADQAVLMGLFTNEVLIEACASLQGKDRSVHVERFFAACRGRKGIKGVVGMRKLIRAAVKNS
jgi:hypothetical protein